MELSKEGFQKLLGEREILRHHGKRELKEGSDYAEQRARRPEYVTPADPRTY